MEGKGLFARLKSVRRPKSLLIALSHRWRTGGVVPLAVGGPKNLKWCPPPTFVFTGRQDILTTMREYFFNDLGKQRVFVLYGLGGGGKSQIAFKFVDACQVEIQPLRYTT